MARIILLLHSHIPYVLRQGRWPFGEIWLFEAMAETYVPLLNMLKRLTMDGIKPRLAFTFSPTLLDQLASPYIRDEFAGYLLDTEERARSDRRFFYSAGAVEFAMLAEYYERCYRDVRMSFCCDYQKDLTAGFRGFKSAGEIEIVATASTHAYLPLVDQASVALQVRLGQMSYRRHFSSSPAGFWLPECGYKEGLEEILQASGFKYFFVDSHAVEGGKPRGDSSYYPGSSRPGAEFFADTGLSTCRPYWVGDTGLKVLGRNAMVSQRVWSAESGYPGDGLYREYHMSSPRSGFKYWRVTNRKADGVKALYDPGAASRKALEHARHFVNSLVSTASDARKNGVAEPLVVGCYDTELFGHWWWEGPLWLEEVIRLIDESTELELCLPSSVDAPGQEARLFESSWGQGGKHYIWENDETLWMWELTREACQQCWQLLRQPPGGALEKRAAVQAVRELLLLESSDWFFMVSNNLTRDYAMKRFFEHYTKLLRLKTAIGNPGRKSDLKQWLDRVEFEDHFLEDLSYHDIQACLLNR